MLFGVRVMKAGVVNCSFIYVKSFKDRYLPPGLLAFCLFKLSVQTNKHAPARELQLLPVHSQQGPRYHCHLPFWI